MHLVTRRIFTALCLLAASSSLLAAISTESPFVAKGGPVTAAPTENSPIELRGVMATRDGMKFAIYEPNTQKGNWVRLEESGHGYVVRSYDASRGTATVEYQGRVQSLTLKEAKLDGSAPMAAPMAPPPMPAVAVGLSAPPRPPVAGQPSVAPPAGNSVDEARRLEQVANEVRRRRAARQAAAAGANR